MNVIREGIIKTRKEHRCHGCLEIIPKGTDVYSQTNVFDGIVTIYMCDKCLTWCDKKLVPTSLVLALAYEGYIQECIRESNC